MIIRMLVIIHWRVANLLLCDVAVFSRLWILRIIVVYTVVVNWWVRAWMNWCWWLVKAIEVSFIVICVVVQPWLVLMMIWIVIPFGWLRLWLRLMVHWLHVLLVVVIPRRWCRLGILKWSKRKNWSLLSSGANLGLYLPMNHKKLDSPLPPALVELAQIYSNIARSQHSWHILRCWLARLVAERCRISCRPFRWWPHKANDVAVGDEAWDSKCLKLAEWWHFVAGSGADELGRFDSNLAR